MHRFRLLFKALDNEGVDGNISREEFEHFLFPPTVGEGAVKFAEQEVLLAHATLAQKNYELRKLQQEILGLQEHVDVSTRRMEEVVNKSLKHSQSHDSLKGSSAKSHKPLKPDFPSMNTGLASSSLSLDSNSIDESQVELKQNGEDHPVGGFNAADAV